MWIKKSTSEIEQLVSLLAERQKRRRLLNAFKVALIALSIGIMFTVVSTLTGYGRLHPPYGPSTSSFSEVLIELQHDLPFIALITFVCLMLSFMFPKWLIGNKQETMLCDRWGRKRLGYAGSEDRKCSCGGAFYPLRNYIWVEDHKSTVENS